MTSTLVEPQVAKATLQVAVAEDQILVREGMTRILEQAGMVVTGAADLFGPTSGPRPDVVIMNARGPEPALELRQRCPEVGVLVLSEHLEAAFATDLLRSRPSGVGYLLQAKIARPELLVEAVHRVAAGDSVLDPEVVTGLVRHRRDTPPLSALTAREREVLTLMADGLSNAGIAAALFVTIATVERHVTRILAKLRLQNTGGEQHRRVLAVLAFLNS